MLNKMLWQFSLVACCLTAGLAASTPVDPSDYTGSRSSANGITGTSPWSNVPGFTIDWSINQSGSVFHYVYSLSVPSKAFSHTLLEVSDNINQDNVDGIIYNLLVNGSSKQVPDPTLFSPSDPGGSNPGLPGDIYGLKFDLNGLTQTISFDSTRAPMWGDIYAKDGKSGNTFVYAYNTGFGTEPGVGATDFTNWIAVPNSHEVKVPEPATYLLMLSGLGLAAVMRRKVVTTV